MHLVDGVLLLSPSDLVGFLACGHLTQLDLAAGRGERARPERADAELDLLARKGEEHEQTQREVLGVEHGKVVEIAAQGETLAGLGAAEAETLAAMRGGAPVIYQAAFFDGRWRGRADFLLRLEEPSALGTWSYEVADAKLARRVKVAALLQMCEYSLQLTRLQGRAPERMHVILGTGRRESHRVDDHSAYFRMARARFEAVVDGHAVATYPDPVEHCGVCRWLPECDRRRRRDDHLSLVAGMRRDHTRLLVDGGIRTVAQLATAPEQPVARIGDGTWNTLRRQAALQIEERTAHRPVYEFIDCQEAGLGLAALPPPSPGDLFFDMEGDPFAVDGGLEYLFGVTEIRDGQPRFHAFWGHDPTAERAAFEALVDFVIARLEADPSLHVYHYAPYEPSALKRLMGRHATREDDVDRLLRGGVLVDLYRVVRQGIRVSRESYSLKKLEVFYMPRREDGIGDAVGSIVAYERWRDSGHDAELRAIAAYNERDCESTWRLRTWLEERRDEWALKHGRPLPRPGAPEGAPTTALAKASEETLALVAQLVHDVPADAAGRTRDQAGLRLLADLLDWHRRENKPAWWSYFDRQTKTDAELVDDVEAIGDIAHQGWLRDEKRSSVHGYRFDGTQEYKLDVGDTVFDPRTGKQCGSLVAVDADAGVLEIKRGPSLDSVDHPHSLVPGSPIDPQPMRDALRRVAGWVIAHGIDAPGDHRSARDLLLALPPRVVGTAPGSPLVGAGEDPGEAAARLVAALDDSCLAVQGPPGAGKTYTGARIIVDQVARGRRVGVCATTHRAIGELLGAVCTLAAQSGVHVRILQKCDGDQACAAPMVGQTTDSKAVEKALRDGDVDVVAGTQWLFCRSGMEGLLDVLVIDEAGQMSLANALATSCAGRNLVLLGDPQQLAQPSQGVHPPGAGVSALEHLLAGHQTVPADRGVFLATTRRMHPDICAFISSAFYEGRLTSHPDCVVQRIGGDGPLHGTGLRLSPVVHVGNRTSAPEEVRVVMRFIESLLDTPWTDANGVSRPLTGDDILIVAPYNLQVRRLRAALPVDVRVGTVDKFQGQQAAVTIYAMATSSAEDAPRNLEFLFSGNRLNVAVSRAQAVSAIVCSPLLLQAPCRTPEQVRLVNALCRFAEMATVVATDQNVPQAPRPPHQTDGGRRSLS